MSQWGKPFIEDNMKLCFHIKTKGFEPITPDSVIDDVVLLDGQGDVERITKKYIGKRVNN
ncbi:hypothetical protein KAR91_07280 [Candidatus Pacearchaeota archaeon]|nr:hypothetical protein [Candidatus Pacearchaeota archaeon]